MSSGSSRPGSQPPLRLLLLCGCFISSSHSFAAQQSPPVKVFVCTDSACEEDGCFATIAALEAKGLEPDEMGCPGCCGRGPIVQVDYDGTDYDNIEGVKADNKEAISAVVKLASGQQRVEEEEEEEEEEEGDEMTEVVDRRSFATSSVLVFASLFSRSKLAPLPADAVSLANEEGVHIDAAAAAATATTATTTATAAAESSGHIGRWFRKQPIVTRQSLERVD